MLLGRHFELHGLGAGARAAEPLARGARRVPRRSRRGPRSGASRPRRREHGGGDPDAGARRTAGGRGGVASWFVVLKPGKLHCAPLGTAQSRWRQRHYGSRTRRADRGRRVGRDHRRRSGPRCSSMTFGGAPAFPRARAVARRHQPRTLAERLRALDRAGLLRRRSYPESPPRVEYELTDRGETCCRWSRRWPRSAGRSCPHRSNDPFGCEPLATRGAHAAPDVHVASDPPPKRGLAGREARRGPGRHSCEGGGLRGEHGFTRDIQRWPGWTSSSASASQRRRSGSAAATPPPGRRRLSTVRAWP